MPWFVCLATKKIQQQVSINQETPTPFLKKHAEAEAFWPSVNCSHFEMFEVRTKSKLDSYGSIDHENSQMHGFAFPFLKKVIFLFLSSQAILQSLRCWFNNALHFPAQVWWELLAKHEFNLGLLSQRLFAPKRAQMFKKKGRENLHADCKNEMVWILYSYWNWCGGWVFGWKREAL